MLATLVGRDLEEVRDLLGRYSIEECESNADVVITHGGDGTLVGAERAYPEVPKVPIRSSKVCNRCVNHTTDRVLHHLIEGQLAEQQFLKVEGSFGGRRKMALNEFALHAANPASALRFRYYVNGERVDGEFISDGLIVATPFGSTAYFQSVAHGTFEQGIGVTPINPTRPMPWAVLDRAARIRVEITRGPGVVIADNDPDRWEVDRGDVFEVMAAESRAAILGYDALTCPKCELLDRSPRDSPPPAEPDQELDRGA